MFGRRQTSVLVHTLFNLRRSSGTSSCFFNVLQCSSNNEKQIRFVEMMIEHLTQNGVLDAAQLYEPPFNQIHYYGIDGDEDVDNIFGVVEAFNKAVA